MRVCVCVRINLLLIVYEGLTMIDSSFQNKQYQNHLSHMIQVLLSLYTQIVYLIIKKEIHGGFEHFTHKQPHPRAAKERPTRPPRRITKRRIPHRDGPRTRSETTSQYAPRTKR